MKSGRFIGVMSGTSLDGVDVVLAAINENMVAQQASLTYPIPIAIKEDILAICQGQQLTLSQLGRLDTRLGRLFADAVQALIEVEVVKLARFRSGQRKQLFLSCFLLHAHELTQVISRVNKKS